MAQGHQHHLTIGPDPWCDWTGCTAGQQIMAKVGHQVQCGHASKAAALAAAQALKPHFKPGRVKVVAGPCPHA